MTETLNDTLNETLTETFKLNLQVEKLSEENQILKSENSASELQLNPLLPDGNIIISVIRQLDNAREIDYCAGTSTSFGYITASSCCEAQEMFLFDLKKSDEIKIEDNSVWVEDVHKMINFIM